METLSAKEKLIDDRTRDPQRKMAKTQNVRNHLTPEGTSRNGWFFIRAGRIRTRACDFISAETELALDAHMAEVEKDT